MLAYKLQFVEKITSKDSDPRNNSALEMFSRVEEVESTSKAFVI